MGQRGQVRNLKGWMGFLRGAEILFDPEMNTNEPILEPSTTARSQYGRLLDLSQTKDAPVEGACPVLAPWRHRQLDMIESEETHHFVHWSSMSCLRAYVT